ncbi:MAG: hypothetical protein ACYSU0_00155 [Planctomycetota bacterium]|jgi:hypothetical protein
MDQLKKNAFDFLPLGSIEPKGWLLNQLRIQADGISGCLDEFWPDVRDSAWFGGDSDSWERAPYWLDGFVPLAFLLKDEKLMAKALHPRVARASPGLQATQTPSAITGSRSEGS